MLNESLQQTLDTRLMQQQIAHLYRTPAMITTRTNDFIVVQEKKCVNFCSNDYLGLTTHPQVKKAFIQGVEQFGVGSGASAHVAGYFRPQKILEDTFADFLNRDQCILFNSGYHANLGVMTTLATRTSHIVSDKLCHASLLDGIQLSRAQHHRYRHCDVTHAQEILSELSASALLMTEGVFSMRGNIAPLSALVGVAQQQHAHLIVDDAHGMGVLGANGRGTCEHFQLTQHDVPCVIAPVGKAFGSVGALVAGKATWIEAMRQFARTYCYTTALPPAIICATLAALTIIMTDTERREKLQQLMRYFNQQAEARQLLFLTNELTPIKILLMKNNQQALILQKKLVDHGFFVGAMRPPTVPQACLRISLQYHHQKIEIEHLLDVIAHAHLA